MHSETAFNERATGMKIDLRIRFHAGYPPTPTSTDSDWGENVELNISENAPS